MKVVALSTIIALASAAQLPSNKYLPPNQSGISQIQTSYIVPGISGDGNRRPQQTAERNAVILHQNQEIDEGEFSLFDLYGVETKAMLMSIGLRPQFLGFRYSYETSNGIRAEEAGNAVHTQGGFSYKGDDGNTYSITFSAGESGFRPQGAHLPVAPPTPEAILIALEQNAKDEAAGIFDDGKYHPESSSGHRKPGHGGSGGFDANTGYSY